MNNNINKYKLNVTGKKPTTSVAASDLLEISKHTTNKISTNTEILDLFSDLDIAFQLLSSSIISPNDLHTPSINYTIDDEIIKPKNKSLILNTISKYIKKEYNLELKLEKIIQESLAINGAYIEAIIPESSLGSLSMEDYKNLDSIEDLEKDVNKIINYGNESLEINYSNKKQSVSLESFGLEDLILENPNVLRFEDIMVEKISMEASQIFNKKKINRFHSAKDVKDKNFLEIKSKRDSKYANQGKPLIMKLPTEAVIPIHSKNDVSLHLGYFVLIDDKGAPVNVNDKWSDTIGFDREEELSRLNSSNNFVKKAYTALNGFISKAPKIKDLEDFYFNIIDKKVKSTLNNSIYGKISEVELQDIKSTIFYRNLSDRKTKIVFLPKDLVSYFAFNYRDNGTGKSLLEKVGLLSSFRAMLLFTTISSTVRNSINKTEITAELDETNLNVDKQMELVKANVFNSSAGDLPYAVTNLKDLSDWNKTLGYSFKFKHPRLPDYNIEKNVVKNDYEIPDGDLDEKIQELILNHFSLTVDMIRSSKDENFATAIATKNALFAKRVMGYQKLFLPQLSDYIQKLLINDEDLIDEIFEILKKDSSLKKELAPYFAEYKGEADQEDLEKIIIRDYIVYTLSYINVSLPTPELEKNENLIDMFNDYKTSLEEFLDVILDRDMIPDEVLDAGDLDMDVLKGMIKRELIIRWCRENNYLIEAVDMFDNTVNDYLKENVFESYSEFINKISKSLKTYGKKIEKTKARLDSDEEDDLDGGNEEDKNDNNKKETTPDENLDALENN